MELRPDGRLVMPDGEGGILFSVLWESILFFRSVPVHEFLFGLQWSPQTAMRAKAFARNITASRIMPPTFSKWASIPLGAGRSCPYG